MSEMKPKIRKVRTDGGLWIPQAILKHLNVNPNEKVCIRLQDGKLVIEGKEKGE